MREFLRRKSPSRSIRSLVALLTGFAMLAAPGFAQDGRGLDESWVEEESARLAGQFNARVLPLVQSYCSDCHGADDPEAKLDLSRFRKVEQVNESHQIWHEVLLRVQAGEMPPHESGYAMDSEERRFLMEWIRRARDLEARRNAGDPGLVPVRRLSNAEFNYAVQDLTGVDIRPTSSFPVDPANEAGFDNSGESLVMSPALLDKYLDAARLVADHMVLTPTGIAFAPHPVATETDRDKYCVKRIVEFYYRQPTDYAQYFLAAWQFQMLPQTQRTPESLSRLAREAGLSPKYLNTLLTALESETAGPFLGLRVLWNDFPTNPLAREEALVQAERMKEFVERVRQELTFSFPNIKVSGSHVGSQPNVLWKNGQYVAHRRKCNFEALLSAGPAKAIGEGENQERLDDLVATTLSVDANGSDWPQVKAAFAHFCSIFPDAFYISERGRDYVDDSQKQMGEKGRLLSAGFHSMMGYFRDDQPLYDLILERGQQVEIDSLWDELNFVTQAPLRQYLGFLWFERTDSRYLRDPQFDFARAEDKSAASEESVTRLADLYLEKARRVGGKGAEIEAIEQFFSNINDQLRWVERTELQSQSKQFSALMDLAASAYRRSLTEAERQEFVEYYEALTTDDALTHEEAMQDLLVSILMSPYFSFRMDLATSHESIERLTDGELASRLSFFLWSSIPDEELMALARQGILHERPTLAAQVRRMLADERSRNLAIEFGGNWLGFRRFGQHNSVDRDRFPQFDDALRTAMFEEPVRLFMDVMRRDRSVLDLLYADDTFANAVLAKHYGWTHNAPEDEWVTVPGANRHGRGGLLAMSVFLTQNSPGLRTSPVKRGYWVVRQLLGERIPAPPATVPELPEDESQLGELTLRDALAAHRQHPDCASCHEKIDSFGLVFEGFGPIGELRTVDLGGREIDDSALFPDGFQAEGVAGLKQYIRDNREADFVDNLSRKLLAYALGRTIIMSDELLLQQMKDNLSSGDYRFSTLVETIVTSEQFLNKRGARNRALANLNE